MTTRPGAHAREIHGGANRNVGESGQDTRGSFPRTYFVYTRTKAAPVLLEYSALLPRRGGGGAEDKNILHAMCQARVSGLETS